MVILDFYLYKYTLCQFHKTTKIVKLLNYKLLEAHFILHYKDLTIFYLFFEFRYYTHHLSFRFVQVNFIFVMNNAS